jgi:hypothetical protein
VSLACVVFLILSPAMNRYERRRSAVKPQLHLILREGEFDSLPERAKRDGPWLLEGAGVIVRIKPEYRLLMAKYGYVRIVGPRFSEIQLEVCVSGQQQSK